MIAAWKANFNLFKHLHTIIWIKIQESFVYTVALESCFKLKVRFIAVDLDKVTLADFDVTANHLRCTHIRCHCCEFGCMEENGPNIYRLYWQLFGTETTFVFPLLRIGRGDIQPQLDSALQDVNDKYLLLEETEKQAVRKALIEERGRFCSFISMLRPVIVSSIPNTFIAPVSLKESEVFLQ